MSRRKAGSSKAKGKTGERMAKKYLKEHGWYVASTEVQGLAGDDIFARDPDGKWWSIEVKNTSAWMPRFRTQATKQAKERYRMIRESLDTVEGEVMYALGMDRFREGDFLILWHPSNNGTEGNEWVAYYKRGSFCTFEAPFDGAVKR